MKGCKLTAGYWIVTLLFMVSACSKIDDYRDKFMSGGAIVYTGKMDSVQIFPGRGRVEVNGLFISDPNITKYRVYWSGRTDSVEVPVTRSPNVDTAKVIIGNLPEGQISFEIRTYDAMGNSSVPVFMTSSVYGDLYQASLINRGIADASMQDDGAALITWQDLSGSSGVISMEIQYTDEAGAAHDTLIDAIASGQTTVLPGYKIGSSFSYKTAFLPSPTAIDTFYVAYEAHSVRADVTSIYLSNAGPGVQNASFDGRWGTLAAPWITNAAAKNKDGGTNGGYTSDWRWGHNGQICWETWGNTPVTDGKIYQPTSQPLPSGNYTITFQYYSEIQSNSSVYCVVAPGNGGIPSLEHLTDALAYTLLFNGANVGATSPNTEEVKSFSFTLDSPQVVSIGFLGNLAGNGNPGNYFVVGYIQLVQN